MESEILNLEGKPVSKIELPVHFSEEFRPDLIKRAVLAEQTWRLTPYGADPNAGNRSSAKFCGSRHLYGHYYGYGMARVPRIRIDGRPTGSARKSPSAVKGRRAHPPLVNRVLRENINKKERDKAIRSAIAATAMKDLIIKRGHKLGNKNVPLVLVDDAQSITKTKQVTQLLQKLELQAELERAAKKKVRAGRGKMRGRRYKRKIGPLIVVGEDKGLVKAANNIAGVKATTVDKLTCEDLAPGTHPGRVTIWTKSAIEKLSTLFMNKRRGGA